MPESVRLLREQIQNGFVSYARITKRLLLFIGIEVGVLKNAVNKSQANFVAIRRNQGVGIRGSTGGAEKSRNNEGWNDDFMANCSYRFHIE